ncbi:MAG: glycosyltransferase family 4 protein [Acidobacteria bacterium]|nr:glycosyltransferase family 4 protein [Acidobacteriota bacterium]
MRVTHLDFGRTMRGGQFQVMALMDELRRRDVSQRLLGPQGERFSIAAMRKPCDVLHAHDAHSHTYAALLGNAPLVVSRRVAFPVKRTVFSRWKYRRPALYLAVSNYVADRLREAGVPAGKIEVVYDGVDPLDPSTLSGPVVALRTDDPMKGSDLVRASGIEVVFVSKLTEALKTARAFVYITREEGLGSAALLAMSAGVPVIASRVGGLPEIVRHRQTGFLVENNPEAIREAVENVDPAWGRMGREMVHAGFLSGHMAERTLAAYHRVCRK